MKLSTYPRRRWEARRGVWISDGLRIKASKRKKAHGDAVLRQPRYTQGAMGGVNEGRACFWWLYKDKMRQDGVTMFRNEHLRGSISETACFASQKHFGVRRQSVLLLESTSGQLLLLESFWESLGCPRFLGHEPDSPMYMQIAMDSLYSRTASRNKFNDPRAYPLGFASSQRGDSPPLISHTIF